MIRILTDLMADMNGMGLETLELPWVEAILHFFHQVGWALFLAGVSVSIFDCAIEAQSGKPAYRDMALNLLKGLLAVSLFTVVPVELFKFCISLQGQLGEAITRTFYLESFDGIGAIAQRIIIALDPTHTTSMLVSLMMGYSIIKCFFANIKRGGIMVINIAVGAMSRAPEFAPPGLDNRFKLLAEFGSAVLCGRDDGPGRGFTFVSWQYNFDRTGVDLGHYYEDYTSAKEDFALRAGLVQGNLVFTPERYAGGH